MSKENALQQYVDTQVAEISPFKVRSLELLEKANSATVSDSKTARVALTIKKEITAHRTLVKNARLDITRQFDAVKSQFIDAEKDALDPAEEALQGIGKKILDYEAEQERIRRAEEARVNKIKEQFDTNVRAIRSMKGVDERGGELKKIFSELPEEDQANPIIKLRFTEVINELLARKDAIRTAEVDAAEQAKAEVERQQAQEAAKAEADKAARAARPTVKTGVKTVTKFTVVDPDKVPRSLCVPSDQLIREAIKNGLTEIPGVEITQERTF